MIVLTLLAAVAVSGVFGQSLRSNPMIKMTTTLGEITIELRADKAPETVRNFLEYVESGFYDGTIFHRVVPGFVVQGGGMLPGMKEKPHSPAIRNEADNGLPNVAGSLAMARTNDPHSATSQFFINLKNNDFLNHRDKSPAGWGYTVFAQVTAGMSVVEKIAAVPTGSVGPYHDVPQTDVVITGVERIEE
jgi:cyclophilin family peptidyl-prolyl cis-trans isomerase